MLLKNLEMLQSHETNVTVTQDKCYMFVETSRDVLQSHARKLNMQSNERNER